MQRLRTVPDDSPVDRRVATLCVHVLGLPRLSYDDETLIVSGRPKVWPLLALLALHTDEPIARERVAAWLWPDSSDEAARSNLRRHLSYVEDALPRLAGGPWLVRSTSHVSWHPDRAIWVDARAFLDGSESDTSMRAATELYRGDFLNGFDDDWADAQRERLRERYAANLDRLIDVDRRRGARDSALRYALEALRCDPFREDLVRTVMRLRFESGDRAGALREFDRFAALVRVELDAEPADATARLHASLASAEHGTRSIRQLPAETTSFVGRARELARVAEFLEAARIVTIVGPPGIGKTRLALHVASASAERFRDGVRFVDLSLATDAASVLRAASEACEDRVRERADGAVSLEVRLRAKELLLVIDNAEGVAPACARLALQLVRAAPQVRVLVTSRVVLDVAGEAVLRLEPFAPSDAVRLFVDRARVARPDFTPDALGNDAVRTIAHATDGLPLALELAAARLRTLTLAELIARLRQPLRLLGDEPDRRGGHVRTLRASLASSYALLDEDERRVFRRIAIFAGGATIAGARAVCADGADEWTMLARLSRLIDHSLVIGPRIEALEQRYEMLQSIAEFARERLEAEDDARAVRLAHARSFAERYVERNDDLRGARAHDRFDEVESDHDDLRRALDVLLADGEDPELGARLALALSRFWFDRGYAAEGAARLEAAIACESLPADLRAHVVHCLATLIRNQGNYRRAFDLFADALDLVRESGDPVAVGKALATYSNAARMIGEHDLAMRLADEAYAAFLAVGDAYLCGYALMTSGCAAFGRGDIATARAAFESSLERYRSAGAAADIALALGNMAVCAYYEGDDTAAMLFAEEAAEGAQAVGNLYYRANALQTLVRVAIRAGRSAPAATLLREALGLAQTIDDKDTALACIELAVWLALDADPLRAAALLGAIDRIRLQFAVPRAELDRGDYERLQEALAARLDRRPWPPRVAPGAHCPLRTPSSADCDSACHNESLWRAAETILDMGICKWDYVCGCSHASCPANRAEGYSPPMNIKSIAAAAAVLAAGTTAVASAQTVAPIEIASLQLQPSYGVYNSFFPGLVSVAFVNHRNVAATEVDFNLEANGQLVDQFQEVGNFAPGQTARDSFNTQATDLNQHLVVSMVKYADGSTWANDEKPSALRALRQADVSYVTADPASK